MKTSFLSIFMLLLICGCQPAVLTAPTGLKASTLSNSSISISWNLVAGATRYQLERKTDSGNYAVIQASLKQPSHSDTGLSPSTRYSYRVKAMSARSSSAYAEVTAMTFAPSPSLQRLRVSANKRYLQTQDGKPFFYMGGVVWWMTHRINREEAKLYLQNRAAKGFNVVTISVVTEVDVQGPNPEGQTPLLPLDSNPNIRDPDKPNQKYFEFLDYIIDTANNWGIYIALNPAWNNALGGPNGIAPYAPMFTEAKARRFGEYLGRRYKDRGIIWVLGGDELLRPEHDTPGVKPEFNYLQRRKMWRGMAEGLNTGMQETQLITFHPGGKEGSGAEVLDEPWLDFVMQQSGHDNRFFTSRIHEVYYRTPTRPVIDGEGIFEETAIAANVRLGYSTDADVRRIAYWDLLSGAAGHAYGHLSMFQFYNGKYEGLFNPSKTWDKALDTPGAQDMLHLQDLMKSRPFYQGSPDIGVVARDYGQRVEQVQAMRGPNFALVYLPKPRSIPIYMGRLTGDQASQTLVAWWFNPRTGAATKVGEFPGAGEQIFTAPSTDGNSLGTDWVLVLDWKSAGFSTPGT
jgi:hypothetical protein